MQKDTKKLLKDVEDGLRWLARDIEDKISWGDTDLSDIISGLNGYADDLKNIRKTIVNIDDAEAVREYEMKAQDIIENQINKLLEENK